MGGACFRPFEDRRFAELALYAVADRERRAGLGTRCMNHLKERLKKRGIRFILTRADETAVGYFERQGFSSTITTPPALYDGLLHDYSGTVLMECELYDVNYLELREMFARQRAAGLPRGNLS